MPQAVASQTTFSAGELDPRLVSRHDYENYYKGAETLTNVVCLGQGGVKRRQGLRHIHELNEPIVRFVEFEFNITQTYLLVFAPLKMYIFKDGVLQTDINELTPNPLPYLVTTYTASELPNIGWTQSADTLIVTHNDHAPRKIVRGTAHNLWAISNLSLKYLPTYDFNKDYDSTTWKRSTTTAPKLGDSTTINVLSGNPVTDEHVGGYFQGGGGKIRITAVNTTEDGQSITGKVLQEFSELKFNGGTASINGEDVSLEEVVWTSVHGYPGVCTFHEGRLWFSNSTQLPQTLWGSVTGDFFNFDRGSARDDQAIDITLDTDSVNAILYLVSGQHLQIFTTGGEFHVPDRPIKPSNIGVLRQTRFGALPSVRPINVDGASVFVQRNGKQVREFLFAYQENSYNSTEINLLAPHLTNNPVSMASLTGDVINEGNYIYIVNGDGTMATFITNRAEEVQAWTKFETDGMMQDVAVVEDVVYVYVARGHCSIVGLNAAQCISYDPTIDDPEVSAGDFKIDTNYRISNVTGTTDWSSVGGPSPAIIGDIFTATADGSTLAGDDNSNQAHEGGVWTLKYHVEALTHDHYTDSSVRVKDTAAMTEVDLETDHLNGIECRVRVDGYVAESKIPVDGKITLDTPGTDVEVGLQYGVTIKTMPVNIQFASGPINTKARRILRVSAQLYESSGVSINGKALPVRNFGVNVLGTGLKTFTGIKTVPLLGYSKTTQVTITQDDPMPMTLLGLSLEVQARG
jgi:hypothetical protein